MSSTPTIGERLIRAIVAGDTESACDLLAPDVHFKALTPAGVPSADDRDGVITTFTNWFSPLTIDEIVSVDDDAISGRHRVGYRIRWHDDDGSAFLTEQQAYYDVRDGQISWLHLICSGDRPI
jgi:hypothetical protein